jgi:hypothetical protein
MKTPRKIAEGVGAGSASGIDLTDMIEVAVADAVREASRAALEEAAETERITPEDIGCAEPFCFCGRRWSQCDGSRRGCKVARASGDELVREVPE